MGTSSRTVRHRSWAGSIFQSCPCASAAVQRLGYSRGGTPPILLLSPLLSAVGPGPHLRGLPGAVTAPCSAQTPPPNPIAAEPYGSRVLSRGGAADHAVTPKAPLTGSGCREHSYGGFGGGHSHFHPHAVFGSPATVRGTHPPLTEPTRHSVRPPPLVPRVADGRGGY